MAMSEVGQHLGSLIADPAQGFGGKVSYTYSFGSTAYLRDPDPVPPIEFTDRNGDVWRNIGPSPRKKQYALMLEEQRRQDAYMLILEQKKRDEEARRLKREYQIFNTRFLLGEEDGDITREE